MGPMQLFKSAEKLILDNSPVILTSLGVVGTITTAFLTGQASFKAALILAEEQDTRFMDQELDDPMLTTREKLDLTWRLYLPVIGTGILTVSCIVAANRIGMRRAAALASAYALSEKAFVEYRSKVIEKIGEGKEQKVREAVAQDRVNQNPVSTREVIITGAGDVLCYDTITGRYFNSNVEALRRAQNDINAQIIESMYAALQDFYSRIGLPTTEYSFEVGWNTDNMLELEFSTVMSEDSRPCIAIGYKLWPIRGYTYLQ
jgi:Family of unknown function (DUF6353)